MKTGKKRGTERTQIATRNEEWSDERLRSFLNLEPPLDVTSDYNVLLKAYRGMTEELFTRFVPIFQRAGRNINCCLPNGSTFLDLVCEHKKSAKYAQILESAGAVRGRV
jgi:hypothetical protein